MLLNIILCVVLGILFAIVSGIYDLSLYKKGIMIYQDQKPARFRFRLTFSFIMTLFIPNIASTLFLSNKLSCLLIIGSVFWIIFDSYMGYGINKNFLYTGQESKLDEIGNSTKLYFIIKLIIFISSIFIYRYKIIDIILKYILSLFNF